MAFQQLLLFSAFVIWHKERKEGCQTTKKKGERKQEEYKMRCNVNIHVKWKSKITSLQQAFEAYTLHYALPFLFKLE